MTIAFRDSSVVIIETGRTLIRAGIGLAELLKTPSLEIPARVGLRNTPTPTESQVLYGDTLQVNGSTTDDIRPSTSTSRASSLLHQTAPTTKVNDYLVGPQLDEALAAGQDVTISWPFADSDVKDWTQAEAIWKHVLFRHLQLRRAQNESPVLLCIAPGLSRDSYSRISQIFFERFNVAGFSILYRPMAQLYAANSLSGVVVDIGYDCTDITPIYEGFVVNGATTTTGVGISDCQAYLAQLLRSNQSVMSALSQFRASSGSDNKEEIDTLLSGLSKKIWEDGLVKVPSDGLTAAFPSSSADDPIDGVTDIAAIVVAGKERQVIEAGTKKKMNAKASKEEQARAREIEAMDLVTVKWSLGEDVKEVTVGKERHRFCEPLFDPGLVKGVRAGRLVEAVDGTGVNGVNKSEKPMPLQDAVGHAVGLAEVDLRQYIWAGLFVTGELTNHVKGIGTALQSRVAPFVLSSPDTTQNDVQTKAIRVLTVPEYFAEYREKGENLAAFLGASIVAKATFNDSLGKNFVSKADYIEKGPRAIIEMSASLL